MSANEGIHSSNQEPWPDDAEKLIQVQERLAALSPELWDLGKGVRSAAGCWICNPRGREGKGAPGDPCWAAAALVVGGALKAVATVRGEASAAYEPGLLALREGRWLEAAVNRLPEMPEVLLVNATGRDHPRRAGLALHLGVKLSLPTLGVTRQPLLAEGQWPADERGACAPLRIGIEVVACWLRTRRGTAPVVIHPAWRTDLAAAIGVARALTDRFRIPEPLRQARRAAREFRAQSRQQTRQC